MDALPEECQYLTAEHVQERNLEIMKTHLETIWLLATRGGAEGKRLVKEKGTYPVIRELHLHVDNEGVRRACERIVDVIMGDEILAEIRAKGEGADGVEAVGNGVAAGGGRKLSRTDVENEEDEESAIVPIF